MLKCSKMLFRRADIGLGATSIMADREKVIDFTVPYYELVGLSILMKRIKKSEDSLFKFIVVMEDIVWVTILSAYLITSVLIWVFDR